ncbi:sigma 54-interacting transcriptional regulator [Termitidicoccus mucosus]|uniref:sigma 54-interacting transcriptional regulator n=1 Tax=Termitidicoccus mucosus TaxID=1184151 RepID=UPI000838D8B4
MPDEKQHQSGANECQARVCRHADPQVRDCHAGVCRGRIVPLFFSIGRAISQENDLPGAMDALLDYMSRIMGMKLAMINLHHRESGKIFIHKSIGLTEEEQSRGVYFPGEGITGRVVENARPVVVLRIGDEPALLNRTGILSRGADREDAFICIPILRGRKVLGTISAARHYENQDMLNKHVDALVVVADLLVQGVELFLIENADRMSRGQERGDAQGEASKRYRPANLIGTSRAMMDVFSMLYKVARTRTTVLLLGESGVGKELIAEAIHRDGMNPGGPMIRFNCAALPESILESELFGHEKGAFTGAEQTRKGRFEEADGGTIFLDEVGELSLSVQAKLLRVLQERSFERVGGNKTVTVNIRVVAATNRDLAGMVEKGMFRQDLYFRLNVFPILIPPLRDRGSDIITLAEHFVTRFAKAGGKQINRITTPVINMLMNYSWPGNVRELENVIERAVILTEDDAIHAYHLPLALQTPVFAAKNIPNGMEARLAAIEYEMLVEALRLHHGNGSKAAMELGLTRRTMGLRMAKYKLDYRDFRRGDSLPPTAAGGQRS